MIRLYVSQVELADNARFILSRLFLTVKANLRGVINERGTQGVSIIGAIKSKQNLG